MITICKLRLTAILAVLALLFATAGNAWGVPISIRYAGTGFDTSYDNSDDGLPIDISIANAKGSFGAKRVEVAAEFMVPLQDFDCEPGYDVKLGVSFAAPVTTFENFDQLLGFSWQGGWMCVNANTGHHYGHVEGIFTGGTGRFEGATGTWMTDFEGFNLEPAWLIPNPVGFRTFTGQFVGNVEFPANDD